MANSVSTGFQNFQTSRPSCVGWIEKEKENRFEFVELSHFFCLVTPGL